MLLYLVINLDGTYSDNENETKRLRSNSGLNSRNADSLSNQNRSSGRIRQVLIIVSDGKGFFILLGDIFRTLISLLEHSSTFMSFSG